MINRDVAFWDAVASHPDVAPHVFMGQGVQSLAPLIENPANRPYASANGGVLFTAHDPLGFTVEMHTLYRPEGWGREVALNGRQFIQDVFASVSLILTHEQEGHWRSRPPKTHGWQVCGDFQACGFSKRLRLWALTKEAWLASPTGRKMQCL